ncbi:unnamed protein product [Mytilus edulis]|uniref:Uncharacterized protein n=1 Tax=Mytilus edulis TaxID=6550 RepID=A0A8S3RQL4_MYTED|nr:unnamed protein product [Mytilus edulis]
MTEEGTMSYFRNVLKINDVNGKVKGHFKTQSEFFKILTESLIREQALELFNMNETSDIFPAGIDKACRATKELAMRNIGNPLLGMLGFLQAGMTTDDEKFNYCKADLVQEHSARNQKDLIRGIGADKTENAISSVTAAAPIITSICRNFDSQHDIIKKEPSLIWMNYLILSQQENKLSRLLRMVNFVMPTSWRMTPTNQENALNESFEVKGEVETEPSFMYCCTFAVILANINKIEWHESRSESTNIDVVIDEFGLDDKGASPGAIGTAVRYSQMATGMLPISSCY